MHFSLHKCKKYRTFARNMENKCITTIMRKSYIYLLLVLLGTLASCSTQKNTWASRTFHQTQTKYNIYYNGAISFREDKRLSTKPIRMILQAYCRSIPYPTMRQPRLPLRRWIAPLRNVASVSSYIVSRHVRK
jgi:hypothetical protein